MEAITPAEHWCVLCLLHQIARCFGVMVKGRMGVISGMSAFLQIVPHPLMRESCSDWEPVHSSFCLGLKGAPRHIWIWTCVSLKVYLSQASLNSLDDIKDILFPLWVSRQLQPFSTHRTQGLGLQLVNQNTRQVKGWDKHKRGRGKRIRDISHHSLMLLWLADYEKAARKQWICYQAKENIYAYIHTSKQTKSSDTKTSIFGNIEKFKARIKMST